MIPTSLSELVSSGRVAADWGDALAAADTGGTLDATLAQLASFLADEEAAGAQVLPSADHVFRAFARPLAEVRVLIVGQDPYPTPGHAVGLSFSTARDVRPLPRSLKNIFRELEEDLGSVGAPGSSGGAPGPGGEALPEASSTSWAEDFWAVPAGSAGSAGSPGHAAVGQHGDLSAWADAGVLLLNRVLTVRAGDAGSHRRKGWEHVTELAIRALVARGGPLVAILWGADARGLAPLLGDTPIVESAHPSPLSASRGFFGSRPFSRTNELLEAQGASPIDWGALN
ncbi:uracil-DNA glycosylase [Leucobacter komagatae]|uniref:Uracil-DNA glycosylase n=1 Tax=Leucobacter komagatae TaxID=55969 RepID=A0A542XXJ5_9MICO|nr:uracil-DNA glycosylase [Leucobacter komagatae]TQL40554.1 uracil-DNA glycosylase [Leucobacter komagatae]